MSSKHSVTPAQIPWRAVGFASAYILVVAGLYTPILSAMSQDWSQDPNYSHGFLVPPLALYFLWQRKERVMALHPHPSWWGLVALCGGMGLLLLGTFGAELFTMRFSFVVTVASIVLLHAGWAYVRAMRFPLIFLLLMIPLPAIVYNAIAFPLQLVAAEFAAEVLRVLQVPVYREGNLISLAFTTLEVTEACSGIRSLLSLITLAMAFAEFTQPTMLRKIIVILSAVPITVVANAARVSGTGILANYVSVRMAEGFFHTFSGWLVFMVAFVLLVLEGWLLASWGTWRRR